MLKCKDAEKAPKEKKTKAVASLVALKAKAAVKKDSKTKGVNSTATDLKTKLQSTTKTEKQK